MPPNQENTPNPIPTSTEPIITPDQSLPQQNSGMNSVGMKVIQPTGNVIAPETPSPSPQATLSNPVPTNIPAPFPAAVVPQNIYPQTQPGMSRLEMEAIAAKENKQHLFKKLLIFVPLALLILIVIGAGAFVAKNSLSDGLNTKTVTSNGYIYKFKFYKQAKNVTIQDVNGSLWSLGSGSFTSATPQPTNTAPMSSCFGGKPVPTGVDAKQVFIMKIEGTQEPVCMEENSKIQAFITHFDAEGHHQYLLLLYSNDQQPASKYPTIKKIFSSIKVSQS